MDTFSTFAAAPIFVASLLGSPHCAGMCGGFVALYTYAARRHHVAHVLYNLGRLTTYLALGIVAAHLGSSLDAFSGISRATAALVGGALVLYGVSVLAGFAPIAELPILKRITVLIAPVTQRILKSDRPLKPFLIGVVTTFLPCGWLYTFVALALASAEPKTAIGIMALFWLGTVPMMLGVGYALHRGLAFGAKHSPRLVGILLILGGALSLLSHLNHHHGDHSHAHHHGHDHHHTAAP
jgi:hypothetical protein